MVQSKPLPDFQTYQERDDYFRDNAGYFTLIKKDGVGSYQRDEYHTLAEAEKAAQTKMLVGGGNYMIYAVIGQQSAFVKAVPNRQPTNLPLRGSKS
jgi:hypothetical protein